MAWAVPHFNLKKGGDKSGTMSPILLSAAVSNLAVPCKLLSLRQTLCDHVGVAEAGVGKGGGTQLEWSGSWQECVQKLFVQHPVKCVGINHVLSCYHDAATRVGWGFVIIKLKKNLKGSQSVRSGEGLSG